MNPNAGVDFRSSKSNDAGVTAAPTFSQTLTAALKAKGLTQLAFAKKIGSSPASVSAWVNGGEEPRIATLKEIALALDTTPGELLAGRWRRARRSSKRAA